MSGQIIRPGFKMPTLAINAQMQLWQQFGTSGSASNTGNYVADMWKSYITSGLAATVSRQSDVPIWSNSFYSLRSMITTGGTVTFWTEVQPLEVGRIAWLQTTQEKVISVTFAYKSNIVGEHIATVVYGSLAEYRVFEVTQADTWQLHTVVLDISGATFNPSTEADAMMQVGFGLTNGNAGDGFNSTVSVNDYYQFTDVQVSALPGRMDFVAVPFDQDLRSAQRYFYKTYRFFDPPGTVGGPFQLGAHNVGASSTSQGFCTSLCRFPVEMRVAPAISLYATNGTLGSVTYNNRASGATGTRTATPNAIVHTGFDILHLGSAGVLEEVYFFHYTANARNSNGF